MITACLECVYSYNKFSSYNNWLRKGSKICQQNIESWLNATLVRVLKGIGNHVYKIEEYISKFGDWSSINALILKFKIELNLLQFSLPNNEQSGVTKFTLLLYNNVLCTVFIAQVCGHRYLDFGVGLDRNPYGVCYISGRSLSSFQRYTPCSSQCIIFSSAFIYLIM